MTRPKVTQAPAKDPQPLAQIRAERLYSIRALAEEAGIAPATVHRVETGQSTPSNDVIRKLSATLAVAPADVAEFRNAIDKRSGRQ